MSETEENFEENSAQANEKSSLSNPLNIFGPKTLRSEFDELASKFEEDLTKNGNYKDRFATYLQVILNKHKSSPEAVRELKDYYLGAPLITKPYLNSRAGGFKVGPVDLLFYSVNSDLVPFIRHNLEKFEPMGHWLCSAVIFTALEFFQASGTPHSHNIEIRKVFDLISSLAEEIQQHGEEEPIRYVLDVSTQGGTVFDLTFVPFLSLKAIFSTDCKSTGLNIAGLVMQDRLYQTDSDETIFTSELERFEALCDHMFTLKIKAYFYL